MKYLLWLVLLVGGYYVWKRYIAPHKNRSVAGDQRDDMPRPPPSASGGTEELRKCIACGTYVPSRNAASCGRQDCPHAP